MTNEKIDFQIVTANQIEKYLGEQVRNFRLLINTTQAEVAKNAGISTKTMRRLENGEGVSLDTFIRVLKALDLDENLKILVPDSSIRPVDRVRFKGKERQRARPPKRQINKSTWKWGDEQKDEA